MFPERLATDSLELRPLTPEYVDPFELYEGFRASRDGVGEVFEYIPQEPFETPKDALEWLEDGAERWSAAEVAHYGAFVDGDDGSGTAGAAADLGPLAGMAALVPDWDRRTGALGAILAREHWGHGYAGECALALAGVAFDRLDLEVVEIGYEAGNERSASAVAGIVERLGGRKDGVLRNDTPLADRIADHHRFTITEAEYRAATDATGRP